jgi:hypothetical protein
MTVRNIIRISITLPAQHFTSMKLVACLSVAEWVGLGKKTAVKSVKTVLKWFRAAEIHCRKSRPIFRDIRGSVDDL